MTQQLDPDLLQTFLTIADTGSFQRAAKHVNRTQSAVSMQIQRLEKLIGYALFLRERPTVRLTAKGEALVGYARRILQLQDEAWIVLSEPEPLGVVRFGIPDDYAGGILPRILEQFASHYPQIQVEVRCDTSPHLIEFMDVGMLDLALISRPPNVSIGRFIQREPRVWAVSAQHATHLKDPVPLAAFQEDCFARQQAIQALTQMGKTHRIAYSSPNLAALLAVTQAGLAIAAMPRSSLTPNLRILGTDEGFPELPDVELALIQRPSHLSPAIEALAGCIDLGDGSDFSNEHERHLGENDGTYRD